MLQPGQQCILQFRHNTSILRLSASTLHVQVAGAAKPTRLTYSWGKPSRKTAKDPTPAKSPTQRPLCFEGASSDAGRPPLAPQSSFQITFQHTASADSSLTSSDLSFCSCVPGFLAVCSVARKASDAVSYELRERGTMCLFQPPRTDEMPHCHGVCPDNA